MLYRVHVAVLRLIPSPEPSPDSRYQKAGWHEAVAHTFGVNATNASEATQMAVEAAEGTVDRNGEYVGGVVVEVACRGAGLKEFEGYEKYFHSPIGERGIFYVSGSHGYFLPGSVLEPVIAELDVLRNRIKDSGAPVASFVKPQLPPLPVEKVRLLCTVCKRWLETDNEEIMHLFMKGIHGFTIEDEKIWRSINVVGPFMQRHLAQCLMIPGGPRGMVQGIHPPDPQWNKLDPEKEEHPEDPAEK